MPRGIGSESKVPVARTPNEIHPLLADLPRRVRWAREFYGWDQSRLAAETGLTQPTVSRLEDGTRLTGVRADTVLRIALALRFSVTWLMTGEGSAFDLSRGPVVATERPEARAELLKGK
jgi:transcriptional regulator with XRE-family HTH domain